MYTQFFGLTQEPFSIAPDPRYLFMSERHREALAHLLYGVRGGGGFVLLTGEIGAGKTTVCRCFLEKIPKRCNVAYIFNPKLTVEELLRSVCDEFRVPYPHPGGGAPSIKDYVDALNAFLLRMHAIGQSNVLIIDEAQNLSADVLEQLRLLTNLETNERKLLQIVLIGQPELRSMLAQPELEQLAQRVIARYHLAALSESEAVQYIRHRLGVAGLNSAVPFEPAALARIHTLSRGVPRRINLLCDRAMLGAYSLGQNRIGRDIVDKAATEVFEKPLTTAPPLAARAWRYATLALALVLVAGLWYVLAVDGDPLPWRARGVAPTKEAAKAAAAPPATAPAAAIKPIITAAAPPTPERRPPATKDGWQAVPSEDAAVRELASAWGAQLGDGEACTAAQRQRLRCFRSRAGLALVRHLDRPVVLAIDQGGARGYATLQALSADSATLTAGGSKQVVPLETLAQLWKGDFLTLWNVPAGYTEVVGNGDGEQAAWLAERLAKVDGGPAARSDTAEPLKTRIASFQQKQGLKADGVPGPITMMRLNRATGVEEPRLGAN
jgi:general secretion pathway protein A